MFHWICPECGREIAPTIRECPVCDPVAATVGTALAGEVEAPARAGPEAAGPSVSVPAVLETQPESQPPEPIAPLIAAMTAAKPIHTARNESAPGNTAPAASPAATPLSDTTPALAERVPSVSPLLARSAQSIFKQSLAKQDAGEDAPLPQFGVPSGTGGPLGHLSTMLDSMRDPGAAEPPRWQGALPLPQRPASNVPASLRTFIAELRPAGAEPRIPLTPHQRRQTDPEPPRLTSRMPLPLRGSRLDAAPPLGAKLMFLPVEPTQIQRPSTPPWEPAPVLAPPGNYSPLEGRPLRPAITKIHLLKKECGPRTTLPGPMLTRRLVKFVDRELGCIPPQYLRTKKRLIPGWMATALILGTLLGAGFTSVISVVRPAGEAKPSAAQTNTEAATAASAATTTPAASSVVAAPLAKAIEVTGFRIQMDPAKKSEIQYLVVNHTPARFSGVTVYVTLYTADAKAGQPPLCKFQFTAPNLAPFQAKDMTSAIERVPRPVSLPDWQDLRASIEIGE